MPLSNSGRRSTTPSSRPRTTQSRHEKQATRSGTSKAAEGFKIRKSLADYMREELQAKGRKVYYQRVFIMAKNVIPKDPEAKEDFKTTFQKHLEELINKCHADSFTNDQLTGFFLCLDNRYSLLMIEACLYMMDDFLEALGKSANEWWVLNRVFLVEDNVDELYLNIFASRQPVVLDLDGETDIHLTPTEDSKFPVIAKHHLKIRNIFHALSKFLSSKFQVNKSDSEDSDSTSPSKVERLRAKLRLFAEDAPLEVAAELLPNMGSIEFILNCKRYYQTLQMYADPFRRVPMERDEEEILWPLEFDFVPTGVFEHSEYDANLYFANYPVDAFDDTELPIFEEKVESVEEPKKSPRKGKKQFKKGKITIKK